MDERLPTKSEIADYNRRFGVNKFDARLKRDLKSGKVRFNKRGKIVASGKKYWK